MHCELSAAEQVTAEGRVDARVLVVDNDPAGGARATVTGFESPRLRYVHEPTPGIAAGRNRALDEAREDLLVFIDDDETPMDGWLSALVGAYFHYSPSAVVGPVIREYDGPVDPWIDAGGFRERARHPTGKRMEIGATNNLLLDLRVVRERGLRFDAEFGLSGGSDTLFTKQLTSGGGTLVWCDEALVIDPVVSERTTRPWLRQRTFRLGNTWARVHVLTAGAPLNRLRTRVLLAVAGIGRIVLGGGQIARGVLRRSLVDRASGTRLALRGAGIAAGALGSTYGEYNRQRKRASA